MRLIAESTLREFWDKHPESKSKLSAWFKLFKACSAQDFNELKQTFPSADYVPKRYTVFDIGGNAYRVVLHVHYNRQKAYVRLVGTHAEYDEWTEKNRSR